MKFAIMSSEIHKYIETAIDGKKKSVKRRNYRFSY